MRRTLAALATMAFALLPATAGASTLHATPSTFGSTWTAARGGDTILLASGAYSNFQPQAKAGAPVVVKAEDGASPSMAGAAFVGSGSGNITLQGIRFTSGVVARDSAHDVTLDTDTFDNLGQAGWEGRVSVNLDAVNFTVRYSHFSGNMSCAGSSDGVFVGRAKNTVIGPGNEFTNITQQGSNCPHSDSIQLFWGETTTVTGNYFHNDSTFIMAPDGGADSKITDNVFVGDGSGQIQLGSQNRTAFVHNTVRNVSVRLGSKVGGQAGQNDPNNDNVMVGASWSVDGSGCTCTFDHNLYTSAGDSRGTAALVATPVFVGGSSPSSYAGYKLAAGSPGTGSASDGTDRGARISGSTPPPPPPADRDGDSIPDSRDACPDVPGVAPDGCPVAPPPPPPPPACDDACVAKLRADLAAMTTSRDNVQALADAYKARAEKAEAAQAAAEAIVAKVREALGL